jgi:hypothetical protein
MTKRMTSTIVGQTVATKDVPLKLTFVFNQRIAAPQAQVSAILRLDEKVARARSRRLQSSEHSANLTEVRYEQIYTRRIPRIRRGARRRVRAG